MVNAKIYQLRKIKYKHLITIKIIKKSHFSHDLKLRVKLEYIMRNVI